MGSTYRLFFYSKQLIYNSKIEKQDLTLDIFVSVTSIASNLHLHGLGEKYFSYKTKIVFVSYFKNRKTPTLYFDKMYLFVLPKENLRIRALSQRQRKISALINDWENIIAYWGESKLSKSLTDKCDLFYTVNRWWVWRQAAQFIASVKFGNSILALELTEFLPTL